MFRTIDKLSPEFWLVLKAAQKDSEARRAKNRRAEAYLSSTL
jgi:hypothetical protein